MDKETNLEYLLIRNYKEWTLPARWILLKMDFDAIEKINSNSWYRTFSGTNAESEKNFSRGAIQLEIISKMGMYIEDLAILAESRLRGIHYYNLLDKKEIGEKTEEKIQDVGQLVQDFYQKLDTLSEEEICKIMSYANPEKCGFDSECVELLKRTTKSDVEEIRKTLKTIGDFGKEHHPVFKRYKHAGFPLIPNLPVVKDMPEYMKKFDFFSAVSVSHTYPFDNPKLIPYSIEVLESYSIISTAIDRLLCDIAKNRRICIQREVDGIPAVGYYSGQSYSVEEHKKLETKLKKFDTEYPIKNADFNLPMNNKLEEDSWYSKLSEFLAKCKKRAETDKEYRKKIAENI